MLGDIAGNCETSNQLEQLTFLITSVNRVVSYVLILINNLFTKYKLTCKGTKRR
jgi:hypothetical protein